MPTDHETHVLGKGPHKIHQGWTLAGGTSENQVLWPVEKEEGEC